MKKIISTLLAMLMLLSLVSTLAIPASAATALSKTYEAAADGDVLYDVTFGETSGVYVPGVFGHNETTLLTTAVTSDNGKTITFTKPNDAASKGKRYFYGDKIDGLTIDANKKYTIEAKINCTAQNFGLYFNFGDTLEDANAYYTPLLGYYGTPQGWNGKSNETVSYGAGGKAAGAYRCDGAAYYTAEDALMSTPDAEGFITISIEIDGLSFSIFKNGVFFDKAYIAPYYEYLNLGLSFYLYNAGSLTVKDAQVLKGCKYSSVAGFAYPTTEKQVAPTYGDATLNMTTYNKASLGQKITDVNFAQTTGDFVPTLYYNAGTVPTITPSADGKSVSISKGATKGASWYGAVIGDLEIDATTQYTFLYKVKANSGNAGVYFNLNEATPTTRSAYGVYGSFTHPTPADSSLVIQLGAAKIPGTILNTTSYTKIAPKLDENGFVDLAVEIKGYEYSVYFITEGGNYTLFETYSAATERNFLYGGKQVAFNTYIYNVDAEATFSDVALYKGTLENVLNPVPPVTGDGVTVFAGIGALALVTFFGMGYVSKRRALDK